MQRKSSVPVLMDRKSQQMRRTASRVPAGVAQVINLSERNFAMLNKDLIMRSPLRLLGNKTEDIIPTGGFGAVLARAGVGKTSMMVQIALHSMLNRNNVLHISLDDPVDKVALWYQEVFQNLTGKHQIRQIDQLWETLIPHRFIMTFRVEGFSVPKLEERLSDLVEQNIFTPHTIVLDGLPFGKDAVTPLMQLKALAERLEAHLWLSVRTHRHESPNAEGVPPQLQSVEELFDVMIQLQPVGKQIQVNALKGGDITEAGHKLVLDPATMLVEDKG
jgi:hypothetical protein